MNISFVVPNMGFGGAERVISILSKGLTEKGHRVTIGIINAVPQSVAYTLDSRVKVEHIQSYRMHSLKGVKSTLSNIEKFLRQTDTEIALCFANSVCALVSIVCKKMKLPLIFSERNDPRRYLTKISYKLLQKLILKNVKYVVFQTEGAKNLYPKKIRKNSVVILNPLDVSRMPDYYEGERRKVIVSVGRLQEQKRTDVLIDAFAMIADRHPDYTLELYGKGNLLEELKALVESHSLTDRVRFMGTSSTIFEDINNASLFVLTSDFEGLPNALLEAMALGLPCVSTRCSPGGAEELIEDKVNGYLVPCGDAVALAERMDSMLCDYDESLIVGKEALKIRNRAELQVIIDAWEKYINSAWERK
ncbi:MAG: glycosyltransferase family 4 protein [Clostridia bacterium]|nr:glycosyltransferase family 4 protein [Clostridia bacterium]